MSSSSGLKWLCVELPSHIHPLGDICSYHSGKDDKVVFSPEDWECFSEMLVSTYESTRRHNPEYQNRKAHSSECLKSHILIRVLQYVSNYLLIFQPRRDYSIIKQLIHIFQAFTVIQQYRRSSFGVYPINIWEVSASDPGYPNWGSCFPQTLQPRPLPFIYSYFPIRHLLIITWDAM
jgi:hypothetical protein